MEPIATYSEVSIALFYFGFVVLVAAIFTAALCYWRAARKKQVSIGTVLSSAFISAIIADCFLLLFDTGVAGFTRDYWAHQKIGGGDLMYQKISVGIPHLIFFIAWIYTLILCVLTAFGVVCYYQKKSKRDETVA